MINRVLDLIQWNFYFAFFLFFGSGIVNALHLEYTVMGAIVTIVTTMLKMSLLGAKQLKLL